MTNGYTPGPGSYLPDLDPWAPENEPLFTEANTTQNPRFAGLPPAGVPFTPLVPTAFSALPLPTVRPTSGPPIDRNYQRNLTTLTNKYQEMAPLIAQLPPPIRTSLINYDSERVALGSAPLTREQTALALQSALTNTQATPEPDRNPLSVLSNIGSDLGTILHSIPRLPAALVNEIRELPRIQQRIEEARDSGASPLQALLQAPGVRMIPGTYTLGNILSGPEGIREAVSHPVMTFLDVVPLASGAAARTAVGQAQAAQARALSATGRAVPVRPMSAVLTNRLDPQTGALTRNLVGRQIDWFRQETRPGQALEAFGGRMSRDVARMAGVRDQRLKSLMLGYGTPREAIETFGPRISQMLDRYADQYPSLARNARGPQHDAWRAQFYRDIQRDPSKYNPALVNEIRDLQIDLARFNQSEGLLDSFDGEWYPIDVARRLQRGAQTVEHSSRMIRLRNELVSPSGRLTRSDFMAMADDISNSTNTAFVSEGMTALKGVADAYGTTLEEIIANPQVVLAPRRSAADLTRVLREVGRQRRGTGPSPADRQATFIEAGLRRSTRRSSVTSALDNLARRRPPWFPQDLYVGFRKDAQSLAARITLDDKLKRRYTPERHASRVRGMARRHAEQAPARFQARLRDEQVARGTAELSAKAELALGRPLTPEEAGRFARNVEDAAWRDLPGIDPAEAAETMARLEREVIRTWKYLRDTLGPEHQPVFVHKVSPHRAQQTLHNRIGPVPQDITQVKERAFQLMPEVQDVQLSLTHQAAELLSRRYSEDFIEEVVQTVGRTEAQLRDEFLQLARDRAVRHPSLDVQGHLSELIKHRYEKFNPDTAGFSWGGARLNKYRQEGAEAVYVPKAIAQNLHRYAKRPGIFTEITDPLTRLFRYNVIGLSPSIIVNNFLSNSVAMMAETGPRPLTKWSQAVEWLKDRSKIPNEDLKAMVAAEVPNMEHLNTEAWMQTGAGQRFMSGFNAAHAVMDSTFARTAGGIKDKLDAVVRKSLQIQQWSDNVYRVMTFMDEAERGVAKGMSKVEAENAAMELVRRTFVDYASFTPIERTAMRSIVPFYSYMSHAARFIMRYPLNHPLRASIASKLAAAERERLGALPGSFLSMFPIGMMGSDGKQIFFNLRPFDPFGDTSDLMSVAGWVSAMNPGIQTLLQQIGVIRGEAEIYPTLRYDPETGRMRAVRGNLLTDLLHNTVPRLGLVTSVLGLNPAYNELRRRDVDAANRSLLSQAGIPRAWREFDVPREMFRAEVARNTAATDVLNQALRTGNWREALRYPSVRAYLAQVGELTPDQIAAMTPADADAIAHVIEEGVGGGSPPVSVAL